MGGPRTGDSIGLGGRSPRFPGQPQWSLIGQERPEVRRGGNLFPTLGAGAQNSNQLKLNTEHRASLKLRRVRGLPDPHFRVFGSGL